MIAESEFNRLCWACRRGMLELDLMLVPFVMERFRGLPEVDQQRFIKLLSCEDNDLFAWCLGRGQPDDAELVIIVDQIIAHAKRAG